MVKKKTEDQDLTRIEDLSEFLHQEDSSLDLVFDNFSSSLDSSSDSPSDSSDELTSLESLPELPPDLPQDSPEEEIFFEATSLDDNSLDDLGEFQFEENSFVDTITEEIQEAEPLVEEDNYFEEIPEPIVETYTNTSEKFEDVKTFAQNFSYGKASVGGGNPPYTIIARHIKYKEDAESILDLLNEFGIINEQNEKDTQRAMELGSVIIPQISEFTAIVLAHKLRRFDLDLEVGLSDEIHPSKSGESNPRGLLKKDSLKQNRIESVNLTELEHSIDDIIVTTMPSIPGYYVESYIGVQTTFSIVEEAELERLQYVEKSQRAKSELYDYDSSEISSEKAFKDYQYSFLLLYEDLTMQLKQKAFTQKANALIGVTFQLAPLQFDRSHSRVNAYQITCSATLAIVGKENA